MYDVSYYFRDIIAAEKTTTKTPINLECEQLPPETSQPPFELLGSYFMYVATMTAEKRNPNALATSAPTNETKKICGHFFMASTTTFNTATERGILDLIPQ